MTRIELRNGKKHQFDKLLFDPKSNVLYAYIDLILKPSSPPEIFTYSRILVDYAVANGQVVSFFQSVAEHDLETNSLELHKFHSSSSLIHLYNEYANTALIDFAKAAIPETLKTLISNVDATYNQLITKLCDRITSYLNFIPIHFIRTLQIINEVVEKKTNKINTDHWVFETLFFSKFLCPLLENPYNLLDNVSQKEMNSSSKRIVQFSQYINHLILNKKGNEKITNMIHEVLRYLSRPLCLSIHQSGMDIDAQERLHPLLVKVFRENQQKIFEYIARRDKDAKISPATAISPETFYSRMGSAFTQSIQSCVIKMNQLQALHDCTRHFLAYNKEYEKRAELIQKENDEFGEYLSLLQHQIELIQKQIEEEKETQESLKKKIQIIEEEDRVSLK